MSRVHPSPCCTQQNVEVIPWRHCAGEQHAVPAPGVQVEPALAHIEHTPPLQVSPLQQSPLPEQLWPRARHWHIPPTQVELPQQSALAAQPCPAGEHAQVPPVHARPLQQSADPVHAEPAGLQQRPEVPLPVQVSEPQQRAPPVTHDASVATQGSPVGRHRPLWHASPGVQSVSRVQSLPVGLRWQRPERQASAPQQSVSRLHAPDSAWQQRSEPCASPQVVPIEHTVVEPGVHDDPTGNDVEPSTQVAPEQARPPMHTPPAQHGWSRSPHAAGAWQASATQASVPTQVALGQQG